MINIILEYRFQMLYGFRDSNSKLEGCRLTSLIGSPNCQNQMIFHLAIKTINTAVRVTTHDPTFYSPVRISQITSRDDNFRLEINAHAFE